MPNKVFISYKNTENGEITRDAAMAKELYDALTESGIECFFATDSLRERGTSEYRTAIDNALDESSILIVVAASVEHVSSRWVEYEWDSFLNDLLNEKNGMLFTYIAGFEPNDLPRALRRVQSFRQEQCSTDDIVLHIKRALNQIRAASAKQYRLHSLEGNESFCLKEGVNTIGRNSRKCDIVLKDSYVSGVHAVIEISDDKCYLQDLRSTSGTILNGNRINGGDRYLLTDRDQVFFAGTGFVFSADSIGTTDYKGDEN